MTTCQLPQRLQSIFSVVDRAQQAGAQQLGQFRASILSLLLPSFNKALRRGLQTTISLTWGLSTSYSHAAQVPSSNVTCSSAHAGNRAQCWIWFPRSTPCQLPRTIYNRNRNCFLVNVQADILDVATQHAGYLLGGKVILTGTTSPKVKCHAFRTTRKDPLLLSRRCRMSAD